tara:strand:+ start:333 stop:1316 length:984 start_codon:yes stop_codon:yes gene_type:complete
MAYQSLALGSSANDGTGDTLRAGGDKINDNFVEIYTLLGTGSALTSGISASSSVVTLTAPVIATSLDMNGQELILDADADTSITASTDDQIDIKISGADDFAFTANKFDILSGSTLEVNGTLDMNGKELILDADADTSITADTDDTVHLKIGGASYDAFTFTAGQLDMKTDGTAGVAQIRLYCESSNAHFAALQPQPHSAGVSPTVTLPKYTGTLVADTTFVGATDTVSGDGSSTDAISLATMISFLDTSSGTSSLTLATGVDGQIKKIIMEVAGNAATLTQSNGNLVASQVSTSIVFDAVGESATLIYSASLSKWLVFDVRGATVS